MADHYQGFAFVVPIGAAHALRAVAMLAAPELPEDLATLLEEGCTDSLDLRDDIADLNPDATPEGLFLGGTEHPNAELASLVTQWALRRWGAPGAHCFFSVAWSCSKARVGEFGGALNLVTARERHVVDTSSTRLEEFLAGDLDDEDDPPAAQAGDLEALTEGAPA